VARHADLAQDQRQGALADGPEADDDDRAGEISLVCNGVDFVLLEESPRDACGFPNVYQMYDVASGGPLPRCTF